MDLIKKVKIEGVEITLKGNNTKGYFLNVDYPLNYFNFNFSTDEDERMTKTQIGLFLYGRGFNLSFVDTFHKKFRDI